MSKQEDIIKRLHVLSEINPEEEIRKSLDFIKDYFKAHPFLKIVILGISGGQDSTLGGKLAQIAVEELRDESGEDWPQFIGVHLPYGQQADEIDVDSAINWIQPDEVYTINIKDAVDAIVESMESNGITVSDFNKGNIKARQRMVSQYALAGESSGVVLGTDHAAENITGFFTKFGDGAADIMPLYRLNKRQGRALLRALNAPEHLVVKVPTADLEDGKPQIPDELALGVTYDELDDYLEGKAVGDQARETIESLYDKSEHKRQMPITIFDDFWRKNL